LKPAVALLILALALVLTGFHDWRPVRALLLLAATGVVVSAITARNARRSWLARPRVGWGHVADITLALAVLGFLLSEPETPSPWVSRSFWIEFWKVASVAAGEGYLIVLVAQIIRGARFEDLAASAFTIWVSVMLAVMVSILLLEAIQLVKG